MDVILSAFQKIFETFLYGVAGVTEWFLKPWFTWGDFEATPILIFSVSGLMVVVGVMLIKFLNPTN